MRLHQLSATAFGPFVDTVTVDFDGLSSGGLFLLTGDTGAGKTSVLDAVCFALYGEVPGDRHTARHLRSDQAGPTDEPRVTLELTVGTRTFRFTRSPAWHRPKRRGHGSTRVQAKALVEELREGSWTTLATRLDETGQLVTALLGMTCTQFTQVAMLPQNRFQTFLRANSAERQAVLQRLFRTERFEVVERWLVERRLSLRRESQTLQGQVAGVVHRFQEASESTLPEGWDGDGLEAPAEDGSLLSWAEFHRADAVASAAEQAEAVELATTELDARSQRLEHGRVVHELRIRGSEARQVLRELTETSSGERDLGLRLEAHRRSLSVVPMVHRAGRANRALDEAEALASTLDLGGRDLATLDEAATRAAEERAVAESCLPREEQLAEHRQRVTDLAAEVEVLSTSLRETQEDLAALGPRRQTLAIAIDENTLLAGTLAERKATLETAEQAWRSSREATTLGRELGARREALTAATQRAQDLRHEHLDLREARIAGMAAELAVGLAAGCSCPVCGSADHPAPASSTSRVTRQDEDLARERHETADFERQALQEAVTTLEVKLHAALVRSEGHRPPYWRRRHGEADAAAAAAAAADERLVGLQQERDALDTSERRLTSALTEIRTTLADRSAGLRHAKSRSQVLQGELDQLLGEHEGLTVADLVIRLGESVADLTRTREALAAVEKAREDRSVAVAEAVAAAQQAGFASPRAALAAHLAEAAAVQLEGEVESRRAARTRATDTLADRAVTAALEEREPDLEALAEDVAGARTHRDSVHAGHRQAARRAERLTALSADLAAALLAWQPVRSDHAVAAALSSLVEGKSSDNTLRMRLAAYVLSERLRDVVGSANERLAQMTDQRYALEQDDERGAGEQRGGLSLRVRDQWSGKRRDPATLSGGETFLVSLALALGLADTVSHEAGGTELDTLFIDEGFGALDATTLDGVMDTLDSLRDGGRVVGLVSHVPELRNRVITQLEVRKARRGSTILAMTNH